MQFYHFSQMFLLGTFCGTEEAKGCTRGKKMQLRLKWWEIDLLHKRVLKIICFFMVNTDHSGNMKLASFAV